MSPRPKNSPWNGDSDQSRELRLAMAKKAALKNAPASASWWIGLTREQHAAEVQRRQTARMATGGHQDRSLQRAI